MSLSLDGMAVSITAKGIKVGSKGKVQKAEDFFASSSNKGLNRKLRKMLREKGRVKEAAA